MWILGLKDGKDYLINLDNALNVSYDQHVSYNYIATFLIVIECVSDTFKICFKKESDRDRVFKTIITALWFPKDEGVIDLRVEMRNCDNEFKEAEY